MSQIKVLHIIWSASMGGIGRVVVNLCKAQANSELILPSILIAKSEGELLNEIKNLNIKIYEPNFLNGQDKRIEITNICKQYFQEVDIIHFHTYNPTLAKIAVESKKKIIYTEHGNFGFGRRMSIKDYIVRFLQKKFLNDKVHFITFNSAFSKSIAINRFGLKNVKSEVVYNGCPENSIKVPPENNYKIVNNLLTLLTIGRLARVKRIDRLINAFTIFNNFNSRLFIVGDGPLKNELKELVQKNNIQEKVIFTGIQNSTEMLQLADLCIFPSQNEAFGLVAIEAYQQGKPVIVFSDGGGLTELVKQIEPELIINSELELSKLLPKLKDELSTLQNEEKQTLRKKFASGFSMERMELHLNKIYLQILNVRN